MFPEYIAHGNDFNSAVSILKSKSLLTEAAGGVVTMNNSQPNWFSIFNTNLKEAIGVKDKKEYGDQNEFEKPAPEVAKDLANQFDNNDPKNIDNLYGQSFLLGYLTEMWDEKNADKTVGELKDIVAKNMAKDINYYHTNASFGVKGIGYTKDVVGGGEPVEPKGKYKSSGYGDMPKTVKEGLNEAKRPDINSQIKELEKSSQAIALEAKLAAIDEAIEKRKSKLALAESEDLAEMIDQSMVKVLNKEIKELEKHKAKNQKIYEKMTGKAKEEVIDEDDDMMAY
jgi:predicted lipid-binding transport protein (Tim44 family)